MKVRAFALLAALVSAQQALACVGHEDFLICPGDTVYKGSEYSRGGTVVGINPYRNTATVRSINSGNVFEENVADLDVAKGCVGPVCVGKRVWKGSEYSRGAVVRGVNPYHRSATVQSINSSNYFEESIGDLAVSSGCLYGVCVGDKVYKGNDYSRGATVVGINFYASSVTVQSINNGSVFEEDPRSLDVTNACNEYDDYTRWHFIRWLLP